jgi:hypothetical protein
MLWLCTALGQDGLTARLLVVPNGHELRTGGDARICGNAGATPSLPISMHLGAAMTAVARVDRAARSRQSF